MRNRRASAPARSIKPSKKTAGESAGYESAIAYYYAQLRFSPAQTGKIPLHNAETLPQAIVTRQVLKLKIKSGEIKARGTEPTSAQQYRQPHKMPVSAIISFRAICAIHRASGDDVTPAMHTCRDATRKRVNT